LVLSMVSPPLGGRPHVCWKGQSKS
jgi:hypothetical protein